MSGTVSAPRTSQPSAPATLLRSRSRNAKVLRVALIASGIALGLVSLLANAFVLLTPLIYHKDFLQFYLVATAITHGIDPYAQLPALAEQFVPAGTSSMLPHASPHPPTMGLLFVPLALFDYGIAAAIWYVMELALALGSMFLIFRAEGIRPSRRILALTTLAFLAWGPVSTDLYWGQVTILQLFLLAATRLALLARKPVSAGVLLGLALLIKPVFLPVLALLALRRLWRALASVLAVLLVGLAATLAAIGPSNSWHYATVVLPGVAATYRDSVWNISLWTVGWRLFVGMTSTVLPGIHVAPVIESAPLALAASVGVCGFILVFTFAVLQRNHSLDTALGLVICASIVTSPISWDHYGMWLAIPVAHALHWLARHQFPTRASSSFVIVAILLLPSTPLWANIVLAILGLPPTSETLETFPLVPAPLMLLTYMPTLTAIAVAMLLHYCYSSNRTSWHASTAPGPGTQER